MIGFDPCGMVAGAIRWGYSKRCRFYRDQTVPVNIVWSFAAPGAQVLPFSQVFWNRQNDYGPAEPTFVGEVDGARAYGRDALPPVVYLPGDHYEGTEADFMGQSLEPQSTRDMVQVIACQTLPPTCGCFCGDDTTPLDVATFGAFASEPPRISTPCCTLPTPATLKMDVTGTGYLAFLTGTYVIGWEGGGYLWGGDYPFTEDYQMSIHMECVTFPATGWKLSIEAFFPPPNPADGDQLAAVAYGDCGPPLDLTFGPFDLVRLDSTPGTMTFRVYE